MATTLALVRQLTEARAWTGRTYDAEIDFAHAQTKIDCVSTWAHQLSGWSRHVRRGDDLSAADQLKSVLLQASQGDLGGFKSYLHRHYPPRGC
jgi:hypothetical protein